MKDSHDKILDAFLDEVLNDSRPSRSSEEILRNIQSVQKTLGYPVAAPVAELDDDSDKPSPVSRKPVQEQPDRINWSPIFAAAAVLLVVAAIGFVVMQKSADWGGSSIADKQNPGNTQPDLAGNQPNDQIVDNDPRNRQPDTTPNDDVKRNPNDRPGIASRDDVPEDPDRLVLPPEYVRERLVSVPALSAPEMAVSINESLHESWTSHNLAPAPPLDLRNWVNRLASRMIGRPLNASDMSKINGMLADARSPELIRQDLIDFFLETPEYRAEFNEHWGQVLAWQILGISPSMDTSDPDMLRTKTVLTETIANDEPLDTVAYQLISAVGSTAPARDDFNPSSSYLVGLYKRFGKREPAFAHVARSFLGHNNQCAQCHDTYGSNALAKTSQQEFFQFHSFFAQLGFDRAGDSGEQFYVFNTNFLPLGQQGKVEAAYKYQDPAGNEFEAFPKFNDYEPDTNGFVAKVDRRSEIARLIAGSPEFRETMVDHVWNSMLNLPLSGIDGSIDQHMAELRTSVGEQLAANDFNVAWLVSTIAASDAFAVGVGSDEQLAINNPFLGHSPQFNVFYSRLENRRLASQSLEIVANAYTSGNVDLAMSAGLMARVNRTSEARTPEFILPFIPSKDSQWATSPAISQQLELIAASNMTVEQKIEHVVQAALGRPARQDELRFATLIIENSDDQRIALQDVWWSLLNSVDYKIPLNVR